MLLRYIFKRLLYGLTIIFGVVVVVFFIFHQLPGDPVLTISGGNKNPEVLQMVREEYGFQRPVYVQFAHYISDLSAISVEKNDEKTQKKYRYLSLFPVSSTHVLVVKKPYLRRSYQTYRNVDEILFENLTGSIILSISALTFASVLGVILGMFAAIRQDSAWDHWIVSFSVIGISVPSFVSAILIAMIFGFYLSDWTGLEMWGYIREIDVEGEHYIWKNLILPTITLGLRPLSIITQLSRSSMLDELNKDYVRTARAKGLSSFRIIVIHTLKNALNPVITAVSGWLATLMAGAFFVEYIFKWKGLGSVLINGVYSNDLPVVMGATIVVSFIFVIINITVDILYALIDPRVRL